MIIRQLIKYYRKCKWRHANRHNKTSIVDVSRIDCISVGIYSYGKLNVHGLSNRLKIGNYVSIADDVMFLLSVEHPIDKISTFPFKAIVLEKTTEAISKGDIIIDDDVWIGYGCIILSGVHVRQGAIIAAGAVVTENVPPYAIVGGIPAKIIRYRFEENLIQKLLQLDYSKLDKKLISEHVDDLYCKFGSNVDLSWFPKK